MGKKLEIRIKVIRTEILRSNKEEQAADTCNSMDTSQEHS